MNIFTHYAFLKKVENYFPAPDDAGTCIFVRRFGLTWDCGVLRRFVFQRAVLVSRSKDRRATIRREAKEPK
jgi:hypothetical protein